jgi:uncharacterized protein (DUF2147 family)
MSSIRCLRTRTSLLPLTAFVLMAGLLATSAYGGIARAQDSATPSQAPSPEGYWKTMDDVTHRVKSVIYIWQEGDKLFGRVEKIFPEPNEDPNPVCDKCDGELKGKPILGMRIMWNLVKSGKEWLGGRIMDPQNGKTYSCFIEVLDNGRHLKLRGYLGLAFLGRTQYWERTKKPD